MIKLSLIVPVYNSEKYLKKCIDSLIDEDYENYEIILVNDGSTDNSQKIIDEYLKKYPDKIKSLSQKNSGQASARNLGLKSAKGEFISFVDSDDYLEKGKHIELIEKFEKENLDVICFDYYEVECEEKKEINHCFYTKDIEKSKRFVAFESSPWNKIFRRQFLLDNDFEFLENYIYEDLATIPVLAKYTDKIEFVTDRIYNYVIHDNSTMRQEKYNSKMENIFYVAEKLYNDFIDTEFKEELEYIYIEHLLHAANLRFFGYEEGLKNIDKISKIMKEKFPNWRKNKYYKDQNIKYKIICSLFYSKKINLLRRVLS